MEEVYGPMWKNPNWKKADAPILATAHPSDWVAQCGVCSAEFVVPDPDGKDTNPGPHGTFCPDCRNNKLMAPGILNWHRRSNVYDGTRVLEPEHVKRLQERYK